MIKKIQIESSLFFLLLLSIFFTNKVDILVFNFFAKISYKNESIYLKEFFVGITDLGDSLWYFLIFFIVFLISYLMKVSKLLSSQKYLYLKKFSFFSFLYLLLVGLIIQVIKHLIGRPRPLHSKLDGGIEFNFLTTESIFHSFPSGHSGTIIAITIIASLALPSLKYFFYFCGLVIAFSRVVVEAHFLTDVLGGLLVAILVYKFLNYFVKSKYPEFYWGNLEIKKTNLLIKILVIFFTLAVFVTIGPELDVLISRLFYYGDNQFLVQSFHLLSIVFRKILLPTLLVYIFILPVFIKFLPIQKFYFDYKFSISKVVFIWISGMFTMGLVINFLLKNLWGRARPNDISYFSGVYDFTPWYKISDSCVSNCSFVSGDASIGYFLVVFYFLTKKNIYLYLGVITGSLLGIIRISAGGHFLSDIIFSQIVVFITVMVFFVLYKQLYDK